MPVMEISQSLLVNAGLNARMLAEGTGAAGQSVKSVAPSDVVGSYKNLIGLGKIAFDPSIAGIIATASTPIELATAFINAKYSELGGGGGFLGSTTSAVVVAANDQGFMRSFQRGEIYWHPNVGAHAVYGPIRARWQELGGENGYLGFPSSDVTVGADVRAEGLFAHFEGGSIYWAPLPHAFGTLAQSAIASAVSVANLTHTGVSAPTLAGNPMLRGPGLDAALRIGANGGGTVDTGGIGVRPVHLPPHESSAGAYEVHGAILEKYLALGAEASILGYPRTDETGTPDGVGRYNHFQAGSIYWTPGTYAHEVHGLIRDRWSAQGWERNAQLGYPISDELIPDERNGHRRPETHKKPIYSLPSDVIKYPAEAATAGFAAAIVNTPMNRLQRVIPAGPQTLQSQTIANRGSVLGKLSDKAVIANGSYRVDPNAILAKVDTSNPASTPAAQRSVNRFADFENGVLFWFRGAPSAITLTPTQVTADGTGLSFTAEAIAKALADFLATTGIESFDMAFRSATFVGTTGYSFDGAQLHNRQHKIHVVFAGLETETTGGIFGFGIPVPNVVTATVEIQVEVWFDAANRRIALTPTDWSFIHADTGAYGSAVNKQMHAIVDPLLWSNVGLVTLPDTDAGNPFAVLSVKTLPNGTVGVYLEPHQSIDHRLLVDSTRLVSVDTSQLLQPK